MTNGQPASLNKKTSLMSTLETLPSDCIENLALFLSGDDFISLVSTGSRVLRHKLRKASELWFLALPGSRFPFPAFNLPFLRSLTVAGMNKKGTYLDFRKEGESGLLRGSKTLNTIDLRFRNAAALFFSPEGRLPYIPIRNRFPSLSTLILRNISAEHTPEIMFRELPENLTTLEITFYQKDKGAHFNLSCIAELPRSLTSLTLKHCAICNPRKKSTKFSAILPPGLRHLQLWQLLLPTILDYLPSTLETLGFSVQNLTNFTWKSSKLPQSLRRWNIKTFLASWKFEWDAPLPPNLEEFDRIYHILPRYDPNSIVQLPKSWKQEIPRPIINSPLVESQDRIEALNSLFDAFPNIRSAEIEDERNIARLPGSLLELYCAYEMRIPEPLPKSLITLRLQAPIACNEILNIPSTLRSLYLGMPERNGTAKLNAPQEIWKEDHLAQLASISLLTTLSLDMRDLSGCSCLAPLAKLKSLKKLVLDEIDFKALLSGANWLRSCLPRNLRKLKVVFSDADRERSARDHEPISDDFLSQCNFSDVTPYLETLKVWCIAPIPIHVGSSVASLPRNLRKLDFNFSVADFEATALSRLPRSITTLRVTVNNVISEPFSLEHFKGLPERLAELICAAPISEIPSSMLNILPSNIALLGMDDTQAGEERASHLISQFLLSHPLAKGFRFVFPSYQEYSRLMLESLFPR